MQQQVAFSVSADGDRLDDGSHRKGAIDVWILRAIGLGCFEADRRRNTVAVDDEND